MVYTGGAFKGFDATYGYVTRAMRLLRFQTGNPDVAIHVAGGVANRLGPEELAGFAAAVSDDGGDDRGQPLRLGDDPVRPLARARARSALALGQAAREAGRGSRAGAREAP